MGKMSTTKIMLEYSPGVNSNSIGEILSKNFPEYPLDYPFFGIGAEGVAMAKTPRAYVCVQIKHNEKRNTTRLRIYGSPPPFRNGLISYFIYLGGIGDMVDRVVEVIRKELPNLTKH